MVGRPAAPGGQAVIKCWLARGKAILGFRGGGKADGGYGMDMGELGGCADISTAGCVVSVG